MAPPAWPIDSLEELQQAPECSYRTYTPSTYTNKIESQMDDVGPCTNDGFSYVRGSIHVGGEREIDYGNGGLTGQYSQRIIERSYSWVKCSGNHAYAIHRK